jgi:hypothetical protein
MKKVDALFQMEPEGGIIFKTPFFLFRNPVFPVRFQEKVPGRFPRGKIKKVIPDTAHETL